MIIFYYTFKLQLVSIGVSQRNDRSECYYLGFCDFFFMKKFEVSRLVFCFLFKFGAFPLLIQCFSIGSQTPLSNSKRVKVTKNVIDF